MEKYENCHQCLNAAEKMPQYAITAQEAEDHKAYMRRFHASHTVDLLED